MRWRFVAWNIPLLSVFIPEATMNTHRVPVLLLLAALLSFSCGGPSSRHIRGDYVTLPAGEIHEGWYFAGGKQVLIHGTVNGDVYVAGGLVEVDGTVNGMLVVAGGEVNVSGAVNDRILAAGGTVRLTGKTMKSITAAGGTISLGKEATVGENLLVAGRTILLNGTVEREAKTAGGEVHLSGTIKGNLDVAAGRFDSQKGALVGGSLSVETNDTTAIKVEPGTVQGTVRITVEQREARQEILGLGAAAFWFRMVLGLTLFVTALAISFLLPGHLSAAGREVNDRPGPSVLWGLVAVVVTPIVAAILLITVIGLPLGFFLLGVYFWFLYLSPLILGAGIGERISTLEGKKGWALFGPVALGLVIVEVLMLIPVVRTVVFIVSILVGLGALALVTRRQLLAGRTQAVPPVPAP
jgi:hypothetical protein